MENFPRYMELGGEELSFCWLLVLYVSMSILPSTLQCSICGISFVSRMIFVKWCLCVKRECIFLVLHKSITWDFVIICSNLPYAAFCFLCMKQHVLWLRVCLFIFVSYIRFCFTYILTLIWVYASSKLHLIDVFFPLIVVWNACVPWILFCWI
jgi:hypothetical protein